VKENEAQWHKSGSQISTSGRLVQEMYFRHLYASTQPTLLQRCDSYDNYCSLLNVILVGNVNMQASPPSILHNFSDGTGTG